MSILEYMCEKIPKLNYKLSLLWATQSIDFLLVQSPEQRIYERGKRLTFAAVHEAEDDK
jgi:hypothetical protein